MIKSKMALSEKSAWGIKHLYAKLRYGVRGTVLSYPEKPQPYHLLHAICYKLRLLITDNPTAAFDMVVAFDDTTLRKKDAVLTKLCENNFVINANCDDISKEHVEGVFKKTFGYGMAVDPETYQGSYVKKSNDNAKHDGQVMHAPVKREEGFVYQKLINNECGNGLVMEMRVFIFKESIPLVAYRYKSIKDRFNRTIKSEPVAVDAVFSNDELKNIIRFCKEFGLDYGELDVLRDTTDSKIYIVDVNNTPGRPSRGIQMKKDTYDAWLKIMAESFASAFLRNS